MRLALVRAGPPRFGERVAGSLDVPLSPEGKDRARAAAAVVHALGEVSALYGPPGGYAGEAADIVASTLGSKRRSSADLQELHLGLWEGLDEVELAARHERAFAAFLRDARAVVPPEAEEVDDARERVGRALARIAKAHRRDKKLVVIVAPQFAFALLAAAAEGKAAPRDLWRSRLAGDDVRSFEL